MPKHTKHYGENSSNFEGLRRIPSYVGNKGFLSTKIMDSSFFMSRS